MNNCWALIFSKCFFQLADEFNATFVEKSDLCSEAKKKVNSWAKGIIESPLARAFLSNKAKAKAKAKPIVKAYCYHYNFFNS